MVFHDINKLASLKNDTQDLGKDATSNNRQLVKVFIRTSGGKTKELIRSVVSPENPLNKGILNPGSNYAKHLPGPCPTKAYRNAYGLVHKYQKQTAPR